VTAISLRGVPRNVDGPSVVAAASGLMLLPDNASRLVRLHRLAALGMALDDDQAPSMSSSAVRALLKTEDVGGPRVQMQEETYSEVLIQSISFHGGPYLVSPGTSEHTVADIENLIDAAFRENWMPEEIRAPARQLVQGLLTVSDFVLRQAGLTRGTLPGRSARTPVEVPSAARLKELSQATFISNDDLDVQGDWLRMVIDTFAMDPAGLTTPCADDVMDDRLYLAPFLRLTNGYRVALPLDLLITIRFHLLRFARQAGVLEELGRRWRAAAFRRVLRRLPPGSSPLLIEEDGVMSRHLLTVDHELDMHIIVATDPLVDWQLDVWGSYDTRGALDRLQRLMKPDERQEYSAATSLLHLVIIDSPGRSAFWGIPNIDDADPVLIVHSDDLEVMLHSEPDGALGLLLFAEAIDRRPGESMSTSILDEFNSYLDHEKSFYFSDDVPPTFTVFQTGDGFYLRARCFAETDRHGVIGPAREQAILQVRRRYEQDAPEIFATEPGSSIVGYMVELGSWNVFVTIDPSAAELIGVEANLIECVAYWVRECAIITGIQFNPGTTEILLTISAPEAWKRSREWSQSGPAVQVSPRSTGFTLDFTETFVALLQDGENTAERELVSELLVQLFDVAQADLGTLLSAVAPLGSKRMLSAFNQNAHPDMLAANLPTPLTGHDQVTAQLLDELGVWLRSPDGGNLPIAVLKGGDRVKALNSAVAHLFAQLESETSAFDSHQLLEFLIAQNEALIHDIKFNAMMLRSRLACFGEQSETVDELVDRRKSSATAHRANRFLIEYVAAQPPGGPRTVTTRSYYRLLAIAREITDRATASDFLHYDLADFEVSILQSGRLGLNRDEPVTVAMDAYAAASGLRSVQAAQRPESVETDEFDIDGFIQRSAGAMRAEFGFTFIQLRDVCGGLLDLGAADEVTRVSRSSAVEEIVAERGLTVEVVNAVLTGISLTQRDSFLEIKEDAFPWRFNRDMSYVRRPIVTQGHELIFGFRSIYRLGPYWLDNLLSGRLQGQAKTIEMRQCISEARGRINNTFARSVAVLFQQFGMETRLSVKKFGKHRIADVDGQDLGDVDILAYDRTAKLILAVEAKDFEVARIPAEIANELQKLFEGKNAKKSTVELHGRRIKWLRDNVAEVTEALGLDLGEKNWQVRGLVVTSDPLITPLVASSPVPVVPFDELTSQTLEAIAGEPHRGSHKKRKGR